MMEDKPGVHMGYDYCAKCGTEVPVYDLIECPERGDLVCTGCGEYFYSKGQAKHYEDLRGWYKRIVYFRVHGPSCLEHHEDLAADAELKRCHETMEREGKELIHLRIVTESQQETIKRLRDRCNEYADTVDLLEQKIDKLRDGASAINEVKMKPDVRRMEG